MNDIKKFWKKLKYKIKHLCKTVNYVNDRCAKFKILILLEILWCRIVYRTTINEYRIFEYYLINHNKRKTYLNTRKHRSYLFYLSDKKIINILKDKELFGLRFKDYYKREVIDVNKLTFKEYENLCLENKRLICRSNSSSYLSSFKIYDLADYRSPAYMIDSIKKDKKVLVEKCFKTHKQLSEISEDPVIINVTTLCTSDKVEIVSSSIKIKSSEIISGFIDTKTGTIKGHLKDHDGHNAGNISGKEIPKYKEIIKLSKVLAKELEEIKEVEWSFTVNYRGTIYLLDANPYEDFIFEQTPEFLNNRIGLLPTYKKVIKKIRGF